MILLPIVDRELRVASRRVWTYRGRVAAGAVAIVMFLWLMLVMIPAMRVPPGRQGMVLFRSLLVAAAFVCWLGAAGATADTISREKREGTLGLLFLTDLKGYDVVLGKLAAAFVNALYALMALVPVLWLSLQLGGVTLQEVVLGALVLFNLTFEALAVGMLVSALSLNERKALFASAFVLFFAAMGPFLIFYFLASVWSSTGMRMESLMVVPCLSPIYPLVHLVSLGTPLAVLGPAYFWDSMVLTHLAGWLCLAWSARLLRGIWHVRSTPSTLDEVRRWWDGWVYGLGRRRESLRRRLLERHPVVWLMHRERGKSWYAWLYFGVVLWVWILGNSGYGDVLQELKSAIPGLLLIQGFLKVWVVSESCTRLAEDRRLGAMELLLTTPLTAEEMVRGHWLALRRQFLGPVLVFAVFEAWVLNRLLGGWAAGLGVAVLAGDLLALGWTGMWCGLATRSANRAIQQTVGLILVLPWGLLSVWMVASEALQRAVGLSGEAGFASYFIAWAAVGLLVNLGVGYGWARRRLERDFRRVASGERSRWGWHGGFRVEVERRAGHP